MEKLVFLSKSPALAFTPSREDVEEFVKKTTIKSFALSLKTKCFDFLADVRCRSVDVEELVNSEVLDYTTQPFFTVRVVFDQFEVCKIRARTTTELYDRYKIMMLPRIQPTYTMSREDIFNRLSFVIFYGSKPLPRRNIPLYEYNIHDMDVCHIKIFGLQGGSKSTIVLPTYSIVSECEKEVLSVKSVKKQMKVQSFETTDEQQLTLFKNHLLASLRNSNQFNLNFDPEWIGDHIESIFVVYNFAKKCVSLVDFVCLTQMAYKLFTGRSLSIILLKKIESFFTSQVQSYDTAEVLQLLRGAFDFSSQVKDCELTKKLVNLYSFMLTQGMLSKFGFELNDDDYSKFEQRALLSAYSSKKSFVVCVLDVSLFICEKYQDYKLTGDVTSFIHSGNTYAQWIKDADRILNLAPFVGNLEAHGTSYFSFLSDLRDLIEKGEAYAKYTKVNVGFDSVILKRKLSSLQLLQNTEITRRAAQKERIQPMGVLVYGSSSIAKSAFTKMLFNYYGSLFDLERDDQYRYTRNPMDEYWSNFDTSKWCIQLDDIAFKNPVKTTDIDSTLQDLLNVVNNVPYVPPQAALEDKGKTPVLAKLVIATSNCANLNARQYFWCPLAVRRRLPFVVHLKPKKEFLHENGVFIDPLKITTNSDEFPNLWDIIVEKIVPRIEAGREFADLQLVKQFDDVNEFLQFYGLACKQHEINQRKAMTSDIDMKLINVCKICMKPLPHEDCIVLQSMNLNFSRFFYELFVSICMYFLRFQLSFNFFMWIARYRMGKQIVLYGINRMSCIDTAQMYLYGLVDSFKQDKKYKNLMYICSVLTVLSGTFFLSKCFKKENKKDECVESELRDQFDIQTNKYGTTEEQLEKENASNVWYNPTLELTTFDVPLASKSLVGMTVDDAREIFGKNCVVLKIRDTQSFSYRMMRGVFLKGHTCITNAHAFKNELNKFDVEIIFSNNRVGVNSNVRLILSREDIVFSSDKDLCIFEVRTIPPFRDISKFWNNVLIKPSSALGLMREEDGTISKRSMFALDRMENFHVSELKKSMTVHIGKCDQITKEGMCGSLCLYLSPRGPIIFGLHMLGSNENVGIVDVSLGEIQKLIDLSIFANRPNIEQGEKPALSGSNKKHELGPLHFKSMFRYIDDGSANVYGSFSGFRPQPKSSVCETPLSDVFLQHYNVQKGYDKPSMKGWEPWRKNVVEMVHPNNTYDKQILNKCVIGFTDDIVKNLPDLWEKELVVLSDEAALNGLPGVKFIDRISINTSMGFPWNTTKKAFIKDNKSMKYPDGIDFDDEIWECMHKIEETYKEGRRANPIFTGSLKDEATSLEKCKIHKTRMFSGAPIDWSMVVRKYLLSFIRLVQKNQQVFEAAPGVCAQSSEWGILYDYLTKFGTDRIVAGDYGKFDKRMLADFILAAYDVIINIFRKAGFDDETLRIIAGIAEDTAFPLTNVNGDLVEFFGTNPSGHPLTVIINSLVNALYMRYCYFSLNPEKEVSSFKKNVALITYGDDNTMGVNRSANWFNHTAIKNILASIGVEYTMADKLSESVPFIHINDVSFLKRKWVWNDDVENWLCPLDENSMIKSLTVWVPSKTIDKYKQMVEVIISANNEYFFHGREKFEEKHAFFSKVVSSSPYCFYLPESGLPTYAELVDRFKRASKA